MSYAVYQYFMNGGMDAVIVRVYKPEENDDQTGKATFSITGSTFKLEAPNPGAWGEHLKISIDHKVDDKYKDDTTIFNITVEDGKTGHREAFRNVSTNSDHPSFIKSILKEESELVRIKGEVPVARPPVNNSDKTAEFSYDSNTASDGNPIDDPKIFIGDENAKTGLNAFNKVDDLNLLCIPPPRITDETTSKDVYAKALEYCEKRRAMLIVDPPAKWKKKDDAMNGIEPTDLGFDRSSYAAIFFPRIKAADPEENYRLREFVPCGMVAGVIARTDGQRGIWKAPAGIEATLRGVSDLTVRLTDKENGDLNPLGINCLRIFPVVGPIVWGARTMRGADRLTDQWKYLPVRRMALYIEESLYRGTHWVVFEPNDEPLWSQIRLNVGAFMHGLFRQGAFQGSTPKDAYFVKCDKETTTQYDIDRGIVNIIVGFAPLKPAEFVIIKIQQITGQEAV
jgi:hypothetical protein